MMDKPRCALGIAEEMMRHLALDNVDRFFINGAQNLACCGRLPRFVRPATKMPDPVIKR
jgi:hypothetical protein